MLKRFILPIVLFAVIITQATLINLNSDSIAANSEAGRDYFIKFVPRSNVVVVEPNYRHFFDPNSEIEGDESGEVLYRALNELNDNYEIKDTKMVRFERKGFMIPNLYVYLDNADASSILAAR